MCRCSSGLCDWVIISLEMLMNYNSWLPLFVPHTQQTERKFKLKLTFHFWIELCLSSEKKKIDLLLPPLCQGWITVMWFICMCVHVLTCAGFCLSWSSEIYHKPKALTHCCKTFTWVTWSALPFQPLVCYYLWGCSWFASTLLTYSHQKRVGS